jgi:hypothetical protein
MEANQSLLTQPQLDLLRMFSHKVDDSNWLEIKRMISDYFAKKMIHETNRVWDEQDWSSDKIDSLLKENLRTPYQKP